MDERERLFEAEVRRRGARASRRPDGRYEVLAPDGNRVIPLDALTAEADDVVRFVDALLAPSSIPPWPEARSRIYWCLDCGSVSFGDTLFEKVSERTARVLAAECVGGERRPCWLTERTVRAWGVPLDEVERAATENLDAELQRLRVALVHRDGLELAELSCASPFCTSIIFAPGFRAVVEPTLGWPVLAAIPSRERMYLLPERERPRLARLGPAIRDGFRTGSYPISTEVLRISDEGIRAVAAFPE